MDGFNKKNTLIRAICFMSFFVAINVLCSFLTVVAPLASVILIIFLPLTSAVVEVNVKDRWFPIYAFATIGLSIVVTLSSIDFTIFYIVPSIFTGYIFGLSLKRGFPKLLAIFIAALIQTGLSLAFLPLLQLITDKNLVDVFAEILRISNRFLFETALLLIFFIVALAQVILSYIVVENELGKLGVKSIVKIDENLVTNSAGLICVVLGVIISLFYLPVGLLFLGFSFYFFGFGVFIQIKEKNYPCLIADGVCLLMQIFLFALLNQYFKDLKELTLLFILPGLSLLFSISYSFLKKSKQ